MKNEVIKIEKNELVILSKEELIENQENEISSSYSHLVTEREILTTVYNTLVVKELCPEVYEEARVLKNRLLGNRKGVEKLHKTRKAFYLAGGKLEDAKKNKETLPITQMEEKLVTIAKHEENEKAKVRLKLQTKREEELLPYGGSQALELGDMEEDVYQSYKTGRIAEHEQAQEQLRQDEIDKANLIRLKIEEDERLKKENDRLKKESDKQAGILAQAKKVADQAIADLKAIEDAKAEELSEQAKKDSDILEAKRKADAAPENERLLEWVRSFKIPIIDVSGFTEEGRKKYEDVRVMYDKCNAWCLKEIEKN